MTEKKEKKKLIVVKGRGKNPGYGFGQMKFSFISSPADGRRQISEMQGCRESVNYIVLGAVSENGNSLYGSDSPPIDFDKMRLLIAHDPKGDLKDFKEKLFNGKAALNLLESINGWKHSVITTVNHEVYKNAWVLTGPKEWMSQPQLLSLLTWVLRLAAFSGPLNVDNFDAFEESLRTIRDTNHSPNRSSDNTTYVNEFWDKMFILLKYYDKIFDHLKDMEDAWHEEGEYDYGFGSNSGFLTFVRGAATYNSGVVKAQEKFLNLCAKHLPRKK